MNNYIDSLMEYADFHHERLRMLKLDIWSEGDRAFLISESDKYAHKLSERVREIIINELNNSETID